MTTKRQRRDSVPIDVDISPFLAPRASDANVLLHTLSLPKIKKKRSSSRKRSTSLSEAAAIIKDEHKEVHHLQLEPLHSANMMENLKKYNKEEQQDLISIQQTLIRWIGSEHQYLILSQFLDLMNKIAPHVSTAQATNMFNQMDPSNNGQIPTSLLLHDEFLPRMILNLFQVEENQSQTGSITDDFGFTDSDEDDEYLKNMDVDSLVSSIKKMRRETKQLKGWIVECGQPAMEKVDEMQRMLDVYEAERSHKQSELQSFKKRLSTLNVLEEELHQSHTNSQVLRHQQNVLLLSVQESAEKQDIEHKKYNAALREAMEYRRLNKELHQLNDQYSKKIDLLREKQMFAEENNQDLRQRIMQLETEQLQVREDLQQYEAQASLEDDVQQYENEHRPKSVRWQQYPEDDDLIERTFTRKRRMTLNNDADIFEEDTLDSEIQKTRRRRNTIKSFYEVYSNSLRNNSVHSTLDENEEGHHAGDDLYDNDISLQRLDSTQSQASTLQSSGGALSSRAAFTPYGSKTAGANVFEDAYTQEIKKELKKKIEEELKEDYELRLKQRDIQHKMELHQEKLIMDEEQRKYREEYERKINQLNAKLINKKSEIEFVDVENDELVYLKNMNDGQITDYDESDDEKEVFDENMAMMDFKDGEKENENEPLINKEQREELRIEAEDRQNEIEDAHIRRATKDEKCLSCFGLLTGRGPWK